MSLTWSITGEKYCCNHFSHKLSSIVNLFSSTEKCQWPQIITEPQLWTTCFSFGSVALSSETEQAWAAVCCSADIHYSVIRFRRCYPKTNFLFLFWSIKTQVTKATTFTHCVGNDLLLLPTLQSVAGWPVSTLCLHYSTTGQRSVWNQCLRYLLWAHINNHINQWHT